MRRVEAASHDHHDHAMPASGSALNQMAVSATLHCLTGCAIGEIAGMAIGTALGWSNWPTVALAIALAFVFGYSLTSLPLLRAGLALGVVIPIALVGLHPCGAILHRGVHCATDPQHRRYQHDDAQGQQH